MKKRIYSTLICIVAVFTGCQQMEEVTGGVQDDSISGHKVTVVANITGSADTKVSLTPDTDGSGNPIVKVDWKESGEKFYVYGDGDPVEFIQVSGNVFEGVLPKPEWGAWWASYGYDEDWSYDLSKQDGTLNENYILMYSRYYGEPEDVVFNFIHHTAILKPVFKIGDTAVNGGVTKFEVLNVPDVTSGSDGTIVVTPEEETEDLYIFLPLTSSEIDSGHTFIFDVIYNEVPYYAQLTVPESMSIESGKFYTATIRLSEHPADMCKLPIGEIMNTNINDFINENNELRSIKFISNSQQQGTPVVGTYGIKAYMVANESVLEIHTEAHKFTFNENSSNMFYYLTKIETIDFGTDCVDTQGVTDMSGMFRYCNKLTSIAALTQLNTSNVINMSNMFDSCEAITSLDLSNFNTDNVESMNAMFSYCNKLTSIAGLTQLNTSNVINMSNMFDSCKAITSLDLSNFNTENVISMNAIFKNCIALTSIDLSEFDTRNVEDMKSMFNGCKQLQTIKFETNFTTSNVTNMGYMFYNCLKLQNLNLSTFDTRNVTYMRAMFGYCHTLNTIKFGNNFNTAKVTDMGYMFQGTNKLNQNALDLDLTGFTFTEGVDITNIFDYTTGPVRVKVTETGYNILKNIKPSYITYVKEDGTPWE